MAPVARFDQRMVSLTTGSDPFREPKSLKYLVTGGAGFIGSHVVDELMRRKNEVNVLDNLSSGDAENLARWARKKRFRFVKGDVLNSTDTSRSLAGVDAVMHLAASPDVRAATRDPINCFRQNVVATQRLLEAMRKSGSVETLVFASSSTVYGEAEHLPTRENYGPLKPISHYGAAKLACEALISSYARAYGFRAIVLRLANVVGPRSNHGVIPDLLNKLARDSSKLEVLGDGAQRKSYLHVEDCVRALFTLLEKSREGVEVCNVGAEDSITVKRIVALVLKEMGLGRTRLIFTGGVDGGRGWAGDVKSMMLDIRRLRSYGWKPRYDSQGAVKSAVRARRASTLSRTLGQ